MIDWLNLFANSLWILGLALALATFSFASWQASLNHEKLRVQFDRANIMNAFNLAGIFFCAGLAATSRRWWEIAIWIVLSVAFAVQIVMSVVKDRRKSIE